MLPDGATYDEIRSRFRWNVPQRFNMGVAVLDRWADGSGRTAIVHKRPDGGVERLSFDALKRQVCRIANTLAAHGVKPGDRVGILLPQRPETAAAHLAAYRMGAIAVPLFTLFGEEALLYRLEDSGAKVLITDAVGLEKVAALRDRLPGLSLILCADGPGEGALSLAEETAKASEEFAPVDTSADDPVLIIYTSGTTGPPKGALQAHRTMLGHLPGVEFPHDLFPKPDDLFWTPADWAWIGGLIDVLMPSLYHGVPVLAYRFPKFDPEQAFALMAEFGVRNTFMPPTALKMMRAVPGARDRFGARPRSIASAGESMGAELLDWGREVFGIDINEFYGQTECNLVVANCGAVMPVKPGSMGRAVPGFDVAIIDEAGNEVPPGTVGQIAVRRPNPVMFIEYWNKPEATRDKALGEWHLMGDQGTMDEEGYLYFVGRDDDVITSGGYRIGPGEIEDCLIKHPAVALAAAVGIPDALRTERIKAFIVLADGHAPSDALAREVQDFVRQRLAAHEYPREVEFVDSLPLTTTGKVMRRVLRDRG